MSISTKKGDQGTTSLCRGGRVPKDDIRVEIYGTLDELCSFLGLAKSLLADKKTKKLISSIQQDLFVIGAEIFAQPAGKSALDEKKLDVIIKGLERKKAFKGRCFCLPGGNPVSSSLDIARTVARRLERRVVTFKRTGRLKNPRVLPFINRLSDLLYLLARSLEAKHEKVL